MHVFHDDLLPIFVTLDELSILTNPETFLVIADSRPVGAYAGLYENILQTKPLYLQLLSQDSLHCFENVYVGLNKQSTWYQYGFKEPQSPIKNSYLSPIVLNFRQYFIKQFSLKQPHSEKKQALLLVRKHNRKILNQDEVLQVISKNSGLKTFAIGLDSSSVLEVIEEILNSSLVIAMHGSLLILSLFLDHHSAVIELFPFGINPDISTPYKSLCEQYGLNLFYRSWPNDVQSNTFPHPEYPPEFGGISHLSSKEQEKIQNSVVKPFLCCDDPVWLYRIYQDTVVDTQSFGILLKDVILNQKRGFVVQNHPLYPGEIQNAQCNNLILEWKQPWNLRFLNVLGIEYEVWLQEVGGEDVKAYLMKTNKFVIPFKKTYHAWIRCHADGLIGPFTSSPVFCTVESSMTLSHLDSNG
ncbi:protein O-linked-mannose beta-1,4-N-acetylglucosaminyltransferase 2 [Caerostris darwini]|uniref:Protein O-linked-mannose beta-1,4-N-acetylglucosaminyltransferase 2 n=1 Tax=Caerostris darwini TaxID=1538125 RepID=A0AAV4MTD7_9ARAC|nr:protein O-linked-mannose beta-1,4-N-acetylglucosaminyltransferase 2 [Caerostris darwini]